MTVRQLHNLLRGLDDSRALVVKQRRGGGNVLKEVRRTAQDEADDAYAAWREQPGLDGYLRYRAAADRADAALDALLEAG
ncbi:hypothetical protein DSM104299_04373 [Baekduia alba]|uniref:hypothetical protein n=1 Tax=Baekduia alba TaxID=2997333 RepID=UPI00233F825F|nr:hypothetical protein [Baekduia alba]WCB95624.1 hypothetical protein DSM104299_04373 [Baekduia alba]